MPKRDRFTPKDEALAASIFSALRGAPTLDALRALHLVTVAYLKAVRLDVPAEWEYIRSTWHRFVRDTPAPYVVTKTGLARVEPSGLRRSVGQKES